MSIISKRFICAAAERVSGPRPLITVTGTVMTSRLTTLVFSALKVPSLDFFKRFVSSSDAQHSVLGRLNTPDMMYRRGAGFRPTGGFLGHTS